jgi:predicted RNA-binding Zn ribbon-like protein
MTREFDCSREWGAARVMYPLYLALAREFVLEIAPCQELEGDSHSSEATVQAATRWFQEMDERIQVHQLRQFLQTSSLASDLALRTLLEHHLHKAERTDSDRDKIDFLLVQYFSHCAPSRLEDSDVDLQYVAQMLEPVLGQVDLTLPEWIQPLDGFLQDAKRCSQLSELLGCGALEKGRNLKISCAQNYFQPVAMLAFTRFSFLMRRQFFRLMHQDLNAILDGLRDLETRGVNTLDCLRAQFSAEEPTSRLRMICQSWKVLFHAEYSSGQPLRMLVDLRAIVDSALAQTNGGTQPHPGDKPAQRAMAAAAGAGSGSSQTEIPEFEVSSAPAWDAEGSGDPGDGGSV